jgi:hypothetical protein
LSLLCVISGSLYLVSPAIQSSFFIWQLRTPRDQGRIAIFFIGKFQAWHGVTSAALLWLNQLQISPDSGGMEIDIFPDKKIAKEFLICVWRRYTLGQAHG